MKWTKQLHAFLIALILTLFSPFMSLKIHGRLVNRLVGFFDEVEFHGIIEDYLHHAVLRPYDKNQGAKFTSAEEEVDNFLRFVPRLQPYRLIFVNIYRNKRQAAGLKEEQKTT